MPAALLPSFLYYCFVSGITPGPANLTSLSTAMRCGRKVALRQWTGLFTGYLIVSLLSAVVLYFVGIGLTEYISYFSFLGAAYVIWLGIHILRDRGEIAKKEQKKRRFAEGTFLFGVFVQLTNVKIMVFCITALAGFVLPYGADLKHLLLYACLLPFTGPVCNLVWVFAGDRLQGLFSAHRKTVNIIMAISLFLCAVSMVL